MITFGNPLGGASLSVAKLRETGPDSVLYSLDTHTIEKPETLTFTSTLPTPRRGNPGTVKTMRNLRQTIVLNEGESNERNVPIVVKTETSFPVGTTLEHRQKALVDMVLVLMQEFANGQSLSYTGILPEDGSGLTKDEILDVMLAYLQP